jgi:hypothetical protein
VLLIPFSRLATPSRFFPDEFVAQDLTRTSGLRIPVVQR